MKRGFEHLNCAITSLDVRWDLLMLLFAPYLIFCFRETWQTFLQRFSHHQLVDGFDCWQFVVNASRISQPYFALWGQRIFQSGYASSPSFFLLGLPPSFLAFHGFAAQRSRARALPFEIWRKRETARSLEKILKIVRLRATECHGRIMSLDHRCPKLTLRVCYVS